MSAAKHRKSRRILNYYPSCGEILRSTETLLSIMEVIQAIVVLEGGGEGTNADMKSC